MDSSEGMETLRLGSAYGTARNHAICSGPLVVARVNGLGYPSGRGWSPESEATAQRLVACWNACQGVQTEVMASAGAGAVAELVSLLRQATRAGGAEDGSWQERAQRALRPFAPTAYPFHLFEVEVESQEGARCFFVSGQDGTPEGAAQKAAQRVLSDMTERMMLQGCKVTATEYLGITQFDSLSEVGGLPIDGGMEHQEEQEQVR